MISYLGRFSTARSTTFWQCAFNRTSCFLPRSFLRLAPGPRSWNIRFSRSGSGQVNTNHHCSSRDCLPKICIVGQCFFVFWGGGRGVSVPMLASWRETESESQPNKHWAGWAEQTVRHPSSLGPELGSDLQLGAWRLKRRERERKAGVGCVRQQLEQHKDDP